MSRKKPALSQKQIVGLAALAATGDVRAAAKAARVDPKTIRRWRTSPVFQEAAAKAEGEALKAVGLLLVGLAERAAEVLNTALHHEDVRVQLRAAECTFNQLRALREHASLEQRLTELEAAINGQPASTT